MNNAKQPSQPQLQGNTTLHFGKVAAVTLADATAKVTIPDLQQFETFWLPVLQWRTGSTSNSYWMPNVGENVAVILDANGEQGVVLGGLYNQAAPSSASAADELNITTGTTIIQSDVIITGDVTITGNVDTTGNTSTQGSVTVQGSHAINGKDTVVVGSQDSGGDTNNQSGQ